MPSLTIPVSQRDCTQIIRPLPIARYLNPSGALLNAKCRLRPDHHAIFSLDLTSASSHVYGMPVLTLALDPDPDPTLILTIILIRHRPEIEV